MADVSLFENLKFFHTARIQPTQKWRLVCYHGYYELKRTPLKQLGMLSCKIPKDD